MNIISFHENIINSYRSYIESFIHIKDIDIREKVAGEIRNGKLWPEPLVQFNPTFQTDVSLTDLIEEGLLHPELARIFSNRRLYRHQAEALRLGASNEEFVVTSGTGSGKSLTYIATIFNHVLRQPQTPVDQVKAIIVYPMNALINSQSEEIRRYEITYLKAFAPDYDEKDKPTELAVNELRVLTGQRLPITYGQFTGQESDNVREEMRLHPPNILLTNYMMLELLMTRGGEDAGLRANFLSHAEFLVFDELHTYRGRQGSDVAFLIRRIKSAANHLIRCIGTSATMVSADHTSLQQQREEVARVAGQVFASTFREDQVITEYLQKSLSEGDISKEQLGAGVQDPVPSEAGSDTFAQYPTAIWLEMAVALEEKEGRLVRKKPLRLSEIARMLAEETGLGTNPVDTHLKDVLVWANRLNTDSNQKRKFLPFRLHQFIAQTGTVYATLGDREHRDIRLEAGLYADKEKKIYPLLFSRESGHEFYCVALNEQAKKLAPREPFDQAPSDEEEEHLEEGYIIMQHPEDEEVLWDFDRDQSELPDAWFNPVKRDNTRTLKKEYRSRIPQPISFDAAGNFSRDPNRLAFKGWFLPRPLLLDPSSGSIYTHKNDWTKLAKLGGEGRSTATTILSFETIRELAAAGMDRQMQKLLSFTDNRQDASLQAGHFNDFIRVGQLRAALNKALQQHGTLDFGNLSDRVFEALNLEQEYFAKNPARMAGARRENEEAFKEFILYRALYDLRRSWRVVMPNLEQCGLLEITYKHFEDTEDDANWEANELLSVMAPAERRAFIQQVLDFFRRSYALSFSKLEQSAMQQSARRIRELLCHPWTLDEEEQLEQPGVIRIGKLKSTLGRSESVGFASMFSRFVRREAKKYKVDSIQNRSGYESFVANLLGLLKEAGWLVELKRRNERNEDSSVYQLRVDKIIWKKGDKQTVVPDHVRRRSYSERSGARVNTYFQNFYQSDLNSLKRILGREHTGQINNNKRIEREDLFRKGEISALFCSPTMELGIDISDLSVVHMRNVPPSPANYAQRSGRAGRSGQAALVMTYCSNYSAHDRHYFDSSSKMVAGEVTAPRMDLINEELLCGHLYATVLSYRSIDALKSSLGHLVDTDDLQRLPLRREVEQALALSDVDKRTIAAQFERVLQDSYLKGEFEARRPGWYGPGWVQRQLDQFSSRFEKAMTRWRDLYRIAMTQFNQANETIANRIYSEDHDAVRQAKYLRRQAERQQELLLNQEIENSRPNASGNTKSAQSEFYPYRYLASEGFLPGYNFTRLPLRAFLQNSESGGEFVSRPRVLALREFGPRNTIYHDGAKYRIDRMILTQEKAQIEEAKLSPYSGYIMMQRAGQLSYNVDPILDKELNQSVDKNYLGSLVEMGETRAYEMQKITCAEEERTRLGYDVKTYFYVEGGLENMQEARVLLNGDPLLHIHSIPAARLVHVNRKWRSTQETGFSMHLRKGSWQAPDSEKRPTENPDDYKKVTPFTTQTANALFIQPVAALGIQKGADGVITLVYALKRAIENYFQVESGEIGVQVMGEQDVPNLLLYESAEGSLGILSQMVEVPEIYQAVMNEAWRICFCDRNGDEIPESELVPATYSDLLSYYNQHHHAIIDRNLIRAALSQLKAAKIEVKTNKAYASYDQHFSAVMEGRDANSETERAFLNYLKENGLRLPDEAQPDVTNMFVRPDFFYRPNVYVFCDGTPHDDAHVRKDDLVKRTALRQAGYQVLSWYYKEPLDLFVKKRPDIFKAVK